MKQKILNVDLTVNLDPRITFMQDIFQKKEIRALTEELSEVAGYLWERRWAERNAGNISVNITSFFPGRNLTNFQLTRFCLYPGNMPGSTGSSCWSLLQVQK